MLLDLHARTRSNSILGCLLLRHLALPYRVESLPARVKLLLPPLPCYSALSDSAKHYSEHGPGVPRAPNISIISYSLGYHSSYNVCALLACRLWGFCCLKKSPDFWGPPPPPPRYIFGRSFLCPSLWEMRMYPKLKSRRRTGLKRSPLHRAPLVPPTACGVNQWCVGHLWYGNSSSLWEKDLSKGGPTNSCTNASSETSAGPNMGVGLANSVVLEKYYIVASQDWPSSL